MPRCILLVSYLLIVPCSASVLSARNKDRAGQMPCDLKSEFCLVSFAAARQQLAHKTLFSNFSLQFLQHAHSHDDLSSPKAVMKL